MFMLPIYATPYPDLDPFGIMHINFDASTSTGNQDITDAIVNSTPVGGIEIIGGTASARTQGSNISIGFYDGTNNMCRSHAFEDNATTNLTDGRVDTNSACQFIGGTNAINTGSNITNGGRLNWSTAASAAYKSILLPLFGTGTQIYIAEGLITNPDTHTPGFTPDIIFAGGSGQGAINSDKSENGMNFGFTYNGASLVHRAMAISTHKSTVPTVSKAIFRNDCAWIGYSNNILNGSGKFQNFTATQFDYVAGPQTVRGCCMMAVKFADDTQMKAGTLSTPTSTGIQNFTDPGFKVKFLLLFGGLVESVNTEVSTADEAECFAIGSADSLGNERCLGVTSEDNVNPSNASSYYEDVLFRADDGGQTTRLKGAWAGVLSTGCKINWTTVTATSVNLAYVAVGDA